MLLTKEARQQRTYQKELSVISFFLGKSANLKKKISINIIFFIYKIQIILWFFPFPTPTGESMESSISIHAALKTPR